MSQSRVVVLLATYNAGSFFDEQLDSLAAQTVGRIDILASDDGSTDATRMRLEAWARRWTKGGFAAVDGPRSGFAENFRSLLLKAPEGADFYAFADQDDLWSPEKLEVALATLGDDQGEPQLYGSRTRIIDAEGRQLGFSPLFVRPPNFRNALVQSIAGGNTMVWNAPAQQLLAEGSRRTGFVSHDWWAYMLVTGAGGTLAYDPEPHIGYRQHVSNQVGANDTWRARTERLRHLIRGRLRDWSDLNLAALDACADLLDPEALATLEKFKRMRRAPLPMRLVHLARSGLYRQTGFGQVGLYLACLLRRL